MITRFILADLPGGVFNMPDDKGGGILNYPGPA